MSYKASKAYKIYNHLQAKLLQDCDNPFKNYL